MNISERVVRDEVEKLKNQNFISVSSSGIEAEKGNRFLNELSSFYREINSRHSLGIEIEKLLGVKKSFCCRVVLTLRPLKIWEAPSGGINLCETIISGEIS